MIISNIILLNNILIIYFFYEKIIIIKIISLSRTIITTIVTTPTIDVNIWGIIRTKISFSDLPYLFSKGYLAQKFHFFIFHFQFLRKISHKSFIFIFVIFNFQKIIQEISESCYVLCLRAAHLRRAMCTKKNMEKYLIDKN